MADTVQEVSRDISDPETSAVPVQGSANGLIDDPNNRNYPRQPDHRHQARPHQPKLARSTRGAGPSSERATRAVSIDDVIKLVHQGLGESTIVQYIGDNGVKQRLNVSDLIRMHEEGVSEPIINAMQKAQVFYVEKHPYPVFLETKSHPVKSDTDFFKPSLPTMDIKHFGPSILTPPQRPAFEAPAFVKPTQ